MHGFRWSIYGFLLLWMASSRPAAAVRTGLSGSSSGSSALQKQVDSALALALEYLKAGDSAAAEALYQNEYQAARLRGEDRPAINFLIGLSSCRLARYDLRGALEAALEAKRLAMLKGYRSSLATLDVNLSSLYQQVGDMDSAWSAAEEARAISATLPRFSHRAQVLMQLARLSAGRGDHVAENLYAEALEAARERGDVSLEAQAWDLLGSHYLDLGLAAEAERPIEEAFRLRTLFRPKERGYSYGLLGELKRLQGDLDRASMFTERSLAADASAAPSWPAYRLFHQHGQIRLARGDVDGALGDFRHALELAIPARFEAPPAMASLDGQSDWLQTAIFDSFIETAAARAIETGDRKLGAEAFAALELNRAASLRESLALAPVWRRKLPAEYWSVLSRLRSEEARVIQVESASRGEMERLKLKLTEMEAEAGLEFANSPLNKRENFSRQTSLTLFQEGLSQYELLLSFELGESASYLWAVSRTSFSLHRLRRAHDLRAAISDFREAIRTGRPGSEEQGARLYAELFGGLSPEEAAKQAWLLSIDDALFELPFAALVIELKSDERKGDKTLFLAEKHSLQLVPGASSLTHRDSVAGPAGGWFLGVGDAIYNTADPRWHGPISTTQTQLTRLVGSAGEIRSSARSWTADPQGAVLLEGAVSRDQFLNLAGRHPAVIHLATHVLTPEDRRGKALIAFGLEPAGKSEFLTTSDIAMLQVPGSLVTMTGCDSGAGEVHNGAGLLGLTRAWQMAGAKAVLATAWAVPDSHGEIFESYYRHLRAASPAEALRQSQMDMLHSQAWMAEPRYWAAYQLTGGAH